METTTPLLDQKFNTDLNSLFRRRIDEVTGSLTEHYEMRLNLEPEGEWVECPSSAVTYLTTVGSANWPVRHLLLTFISECRKTDRVLADVDRMRTLRDTALANHEHDLETIGQRLIEESDERGWCDEFDRIIDDVNESLHGTLPLRVQEFDLIVDVVIPSSTTVTVKARNEQEAVDLVQSNPSEYINMEDFYIDDYEVADVSIS
jgi:hypothetical protein